MLRRRCTATAALESCPDFFHGRRSAFFAAHVPTHTLRLSLFVCVCLLHRNTAGHFDQRAERRSAAPHFIRAVLQRHAGALQANVCCTTSGLPSRLNVSRRCCAVLQVFLARLNAAQRCATHPRLRHSIRKHSNNANGQRPPPPRCVDVSVMKTRSANVNSKKRKTTKPCTFRCAALPAHETY